MRIIIVIINNNRKEEREGAEGEKGEGTGGRNEEKRQNHCWVLETRRAHGQPDFVSCSPPYVKSWGKTVLWHSLRETGGSPWISVTVLRRLAKCSQAIYTSLKRTRSF